MKTLAELEAEWYKLDKGLDGLMSSPEEDWNMAMKKKDNLEGQISILKEVEPLLKEREEMLALLKEITQSHPSPFSARGKCMCKVCNYLSKLGE